MKNFIARSSNLMPSFQYFIWVLLFIFPCFFSLSFSDPRITIDARFCGPIRTSDKNFIPTFVKLMEQVSQQVTDRNWGFQSLTTPPVLYALAQCHRDLANVECLQCYAESRTKLSCLPSIAGRIFLDGCFLRYDNHNFFNESIDPEYDTNQCNSSVVDENYARSVFAKKVDMVLVNSTEIAMSNEGFGVAAVKGGVDNVYALAQCWRSLSNNGCRECLLNARNELRKCVPGKDGRRLNAGCYLRYSTQEFYNDGQIKQALSAGTRRTMIIAIALSTVAFIMITIFGMFIGYARLSKKRKERDNLGRLPSAMNKSSLIIKYETLEKATDFFDPSRKLGQGGAGSVFKGTLPDGKNVAVKRLFFNTRQWVDEFFNEVNLINGIQHKNLVKLLGCSIEGPESLLVYEYLPNKSLDQFLFEKSKTQIVSWKQRFDIIVGIAEGLAYLHGGSQIRIIHRDIKSSNILLDENMTAKIADFGLARCFEDDKSHLSTGIAGTLGYMAPEYLVRGQLTEKADVYSFGVLVQEIVCGRKNSVFTQELGSVLQTVWQHYKSNTLPESVDPCLRGNFPVKEASDVLQVGLLCTQASVTLRPSMAEVVQMLMDKGHTIPLPMQPPFLNASVINPDTSSISYSMPSSESNESTTIEVSGPR